MIMEVETGDTCVGLDDKNRIARLNNLIAECTCPLCQGLMERPQMLHCKHSLCQRCLTRLRRRAIPAGGLHCPVCREKSDPSYHAQSDHTTEKLLEVLRQVKSNLCQEVDCWCIPSTRCPGCCTLMCRQHHENYISKLRVSCTNICDSTEAFVANFSGENKLLSLHVAEEALEKLGHELISNLEDRMLNCKQKLEQHKNSFAEEQVNSKPMLDEIKTKLEDLKQLQATDNFAAMQSAQAQLRRLLARAKQQHPPTEICPPPPLDDCLRGLDGVLARVRVDTVVRPYGSGEGAARLRRCLRTRPLQPWDLALLTNLDNVFLTPDGPTVGFKPGARRPAGPCLLLVNYKGFPTKRLHAFDADGDEAGAIRLGLKSGEMPGKFAVCNSRQLILATEPSHHCVFVFSLAGEQLKRFGRRGTEPGCFNEPMGLFPW